MSDLNFNIPFEPFTSTRYNFAMLTGRVFGRLTVISIFGKNKHQKTLWLCLCKCSAWCIATGDNLQRNKVKSCGCLRENHQPRRIHGYARKNKSQRPPEYRTYEQGRNRCNNPNSPQYANYGGRGIKWLFTSFSHFLSSLGFRPSSDYSLDRIDNNGHYAPDNCRWATRTQQVRNRRVTRFLTVDGTTKSAAEWGDIFGITGKLICARISRGWAVDEAVKQPLKKGLALKYRQTISVGH